MACKFGFTVEGPKGYCWLCNGLICVGKFHADARVDMKYETTGTPVKDIRGMVRFDAFASYACGWHDARGDKLFCWHCHLQSQTNPADFNAAYRLKMDCLRKQAAEVITLEQLAREKLANDQRERIMRERLLAARPAAAAYAAAQGVKSRI